MDQISAEIGGTGSDVLLLVAAGIVTALACGLGVVPVFFLDEKLDPQGRVVASKRALRGLACGLMGVASVEGLLRPAVAQGGFIRAGIGFVVGVVFTLAMRQFMERRDVEVGNLRGSGVRKSALVFAVLFFHSLPEGMAMGAAQASGVEGLSVYVIAAIALQNIPEGTAIAIPMAGAGFGRSAMFWAAVATSIPQPIGAPLAYLLVEQMASLLPLSLAFAGGAMLAVVVVELAPDTFTRKDWKSGAVGTLAGALVMVGLGIALRV